MNRIVTATVKLQGPPSFVKRIFDVISREFIIAYATQPLANDGDNGVHQFLTIVDEGRAHM